MHEFKLPDIGEGLSEAELLEWTVKTGDLIKESDEVAQISTDKVNVDLLAPVSGRVVELLGQPGDVIAVGTVIMRIDTGNKTDQPQEAAGTTSQPTSPQPPVVKKPINGGVSIKAAPIVRKYAADLGVDLTLLTGGGPGGQIIKADIDRYQTGSNTAEINKGETSKKLSGARLVAARNLAESHAKQVTTNITFELRADAVQNRLLALADEADQHNFGLSPAAVVAKCLADTLLQHPNFNAVIGEGEYEVCLRDSVDLGMAVSTDQGLLVPVIRNVETKNIVEIGAELSRLSELARSGEISRGELTGSSFTLSSTGGLEKAKLIATTPIINYPNVATLWVSRITIQPRVTEGKLEAGPVMYGSLSFDHRFLHGADGILFINAFESAVTSIS
jgi:pyruvate/2-oxoglutarate dehydrogenase complex dihydrolipoamide acyltransferase (E2) component